MFLFARSILKFCLTLTLLCCLGNVFAADKENKQAHFLVLTDIHFDPFISCQSSPCPLIQKLNQAPASQWSKILTTYDNNPPIYRKETNYNLLVSALAAAKTVAEDQHAKFVLILGDYIGHDYRSLYKRYSKDRSSAGYRAFVRKTMQFLNIEFSHSFPNIDVYPLVGNNDSYHYDYYTQPNGAYFQDMGKLWSALIKNKDNQAAIQHDFATGGYYAFNAPNQPNLRVIMLNSNLFSTVAQGNGIEAAATQELDWLDQQLTEAKANHQRAIIAMHIPKGVDIFMTLRVRLFTLIEFWQKKYSERFNAILKGHADEVSGIFAGHLHSDWFQILAFNNNNEIPLMGVPSISPIFGNNPGFKVYNYSTDSLQIEDFVTYFYSLAKHKTWQEAYNFNQIYLPDCRNCSIVNGMKQMSKENHLAEHYKLFYKMGAQDEPILTNWSPYYWCSIRSNSAADYKKCIK